MAQVQFLFLGNFPKNVINLRATLWVARRAAAQIDPSITRILIKGGAHDGTMVTATGEKIQDPLHYTFHFKNDKLAREGKHFSAHAYVLLDAKNNAGNWYNTQLKPRYDEDGKTLHVDNDDYFDVRKQKQWNKWDPKLNKITVFPEDELKEFYVGKDFLSFATDFLKRAKPAELKEIEADQKKTKELTEKEDL